MSTAETAGVHGNPLAGTAPPAAMAEGKGKRDLRRLIGRVKFFDAERGLGFIYFGDGSQDAMVKAECLGEHGLERLLPETTVASHVECRADGRRRVHRIWAVDESTVPATAREPAPRRTDTVPTRAGPVEPSATRTRVLPVKMYNADDGWGFLQGGEGEDDVFVHVSVVHAAGLTYIAPGQAYEVDFGPSRKGPCALAIRRSEAQGPR